MLNKAQHIALLPGVGKGSSALRNLALKLLETSDPMPGETSSHSKGPLSPGVSGQNKHQRSMAWVVPSLPRCVGPSRVFTSLPLCEKFQTPLFFPAIHVPFKIILCRPLPAQPSNCLPFSLLLMESPPTKKSLPLSYSCMQSSTKRHWFPGILPKMLEDLSVFAFPKLSFCPWALKEGYSAILSAEAGLKRAATVGRAYWGHQRGLGTRSCLFKVYNPLQGQLTSPGTLRAGTSIGHLCLQYWEHCLAP